MGECLISRKSNLGGSGSSFSFNRLPVLDTSYPLDQEIDLRLTNSANFIISIAEHGRPTTYTYQWYKNDVIIEGANSPICTIKDILEVTSTPISIYCIVSNDAGSVTSRVAYLNVIKTSVPVLDPEYPKDAIITVGNSVNFTINIATEGNPTNYTYQWYKNNIPIANATSNTCTLNDLTAGTYNVYCTVSNIAGSINSRVATATVNTLLPTLSTNVGGTLVDEGNGNWNITWKTSGSLVMDTDRIVDIYLVGGGAGGGGRDQDKGAGGGGGGDVVFYKQVLLKGNTISSIVIGAGGTGSARYVDSATAGGTTSFKNTDSGITYTAIGGNPGKMASYGTGCDGSGNGGAGSSSDTTSGAPGGDGKTLPFNLSGSAVSTYYGGGGGGGGGRYEGRGGAGGAGGGGAGGHGTECGASGDLTVNGGSAIANRGGGGGGMGGDAEGTGGNGSAGIVIVTNAR